MVEIWLYLRWPSMNCLYMLASVSSQTGCVVLSVLLHFLFLAAFMFLTLESHAISFLLVNQIFNPFQVSESQTMEILNLFQVGQSQNLIFNHFQVGQSQTRYLTPSSLIRAKPDIQPLPGWLKPDQISNFFQVSESQPSCLSDRHKFL